MRERKREERERKRVGVRMAEDALHVQLTLPYDNLSTVLSRAPVRAKAPPMIMRGGALCHGIVR